MIWRTLKHWWYEQIASRVNPRQRWLTKQIDRRWVDKDTLIEDLLYAILIHYVEGERGFEETDWPGSGAAEQKTQLQEAYEWAKTGRVALQARIEAAYPPPYNEFNVTDWIIGKNPARDADYREVWRLQVELDATDTRHLTTIVALRGYLWT